MRDFQRKRKIRKALYSKGVLAVVFVLFALVSKSTWGLYAKERESSKNLNRIEQELSALTLREERLQNDIARLKTPEGIEFEIREQFQVAKHGEQMVVLVPEQKNKPEQKIEERSLVSKFLDIFR